jgi:membrane associated rhomboid family serine protease/RNAse (barnase) inhibitor barstar
MKMFYAKLRLIFLPFAIATLCTVCFYSFLNWLLIVKLNLIKVDEEVINFFIPFVLPWVPLLIWIRPRIKLLRLNTTGRRNPVTGLLMLLWVTMAVPIIIAQAYMVTATGKLTNLNNISEIIHTPPTKYYKARHFYASKGFAHVKPAFSVSGKYNEHLDMTIYVAVPVFDAVFPDTNKISRIRNRIDSRALIILNGKVSSIGAVKKLPADSIKFMDIMSASMLMPMYGDSGRYGGLMVLTKGYKLKPTWKLPPFKIYPAAWLAVDFRKTVSNHLSPREKEEAYKAFVLESQSEFERRDLDTFAYLDRVPYGRDLTNYQLAIASKNDVANGDQIILSPVNEPFDARNGNKLAWIFGSFGVGSVIFLIIIQFIKLKSNTEIKEFDGHKENSGWDDVRNLLWPRVGFTVTPIIIDINILMFILMACSGLGFISFDAPGLLAWGANYRPDVNDGQYWRLITNTFLHGGIMHLLFNMYGLLFVGVFLEPLLGRYKYAAVYLITGLLASVASVWWHPATISVGASGAIFGLYGIFLALLTTNLFPKDFKKSFLISTAFFVGYNLLFGLTGGIDNAAHLGGLLSGLIIGYVLYPWLKDKVDSMEEEKEIQVLAEETHAKSNTDIEESKILVITIDGANFNDLESFYREVDRQFIKGITWKTGHNLDSFNDLLRGGFGVYDYHEPIELVWKNFEKSKNDLGMETINTIVKVIDEHDHINFQAK